MKHKNSLTELKNYFGCDAREFLDAWNTMTAKEKDYWFYFDLTQ